MRIPSVLASILLHGSLLGTAAVLLGDGPAHPHRRVARVLVAPSVPSVPSRPTPDEPVVIEEPAFVEELPAVEEPVVVEEAPQLAEPEQPFVLRSAPELPVAAELFEKVRRARVDEPEPVESRSPPKVEEPAPATPAPPAPWVEARPRDDVNRPPDYPLEARRRGQSGEVLLRVSVAADGEVRGVEIERPSRYPLLDRAAVRAARDWRFEPALRHGVPVESDTLVPIEFRLER